MSNVVEYIMRMRDLMSGPMQNVARAAQTVNNTLKNTTGETQRLPRNIQQLSSTLAGLQHRQRQAFDEKHIAGYTVMIRRVQNELNRLNNLPPAGFIQRLKEGERSASGLGSTLGRVIGITAAFAGVKSMVQMGAALEQQKISFEVMLGSAEKAKNMLGSLNQFANVTPYENAGLIENAKLLLNFGTSAEKIIPTLKMIGDVAMGDQGKMNGLSLAFAQMSSVGKLQGQDLLQMINAGFNPLQELTKMTGKSMAQLREAMEKGKISAGIVEQAFQHATSKGGMFFGMMDKMSQSSSGKFSTLVGTLKSAGAALGEKLLPLINKFLEKGIAVTNWISENIDLVMQLGAVVLGAMVAFKLITGAMAILNGVMLMNPIGLIIAGIAALVAGVVYCYNKFAVFRGVIDGTWAVIKKFAGYMKDGVINIVKGLADTFMGLGKIIKGVFTLDWDTVKEGAKTTMEGFKKVGSGMIDASPVGAAIKHGKELGQAAVKGYKDGVATGRQKNAEKAGTKNVGDFITPEAGQGTGSSPAANYDPAKSMDNIAKGGSRPTNITINLQKELIGQFTIMPATLKEGITEMGDVVKEELFKILNSTNLIATN